MKDWVIDITIAAYLAKSRNKQVKRMALKAKKKNKQDQESVAICEELISSPCPAKLARLSWEQYNEYR